MASRYHLALSKFRSLIKFSLETWVYYLISIGKLVVEMHACLYVLKTFIGELFNASVKIN
jgi:hypothetical protein